MPAPDAFLAACPSRPLLARLGEKWAMLLIVRLKEGPVRFGALRRGIEGLSQKMLTQTLRHLERDGVVERRLVDSRPLSVEYSLTPLGRDLLPLAQALKAWAEEHLPATQAANARYDAAHR